MKSPENGESYGSHKNASTQTFDNHPSPVRNQDLCGLCGKRGLSELDEIPFGCNIPPNICQCFFSNKDNAPESIFAIEQDYESSSIQGCDSQNVNPLPVIEASSAAESINVSIKDGSSEDLQIPEFNQNSNDLDKLSTDRNSADRRNSASPRSDEYSKSSSNTERGNISSGYALSLREQSSDQTNFTSPSSGGDSKNSSNKETSPSSGYAMSLGEQSLDRNFTDNRNITTSSSSGEDTKSCPNVERGKKYELDLDNSNTVSKFQNKTEYRSSQSSPSEQGHRNIKQLRAGEFSRSESMVKYSCSNDSKQKSEHNSSQSSPSDQGCTNINQLEKKEFNNSESTENNNSNKTRQLVADLYTRGEFRFENRNRFTNYRPPLPRPFSSLNSKPHQPFRNPLINMPVPTPYPAPYTQQHTKPLYTWGTPAANMPVIRTNIPGRFTVTARPQASTSYQRPNSEGSGSLSKQSLAQVDKMDSDRNVTRRIDRIEDWIKAIPIDCIHPDDESKTQWSTDKNESKPPEGPGLPETSTDERSSTEKSEEENLRQRSLRRPPRYNKKGRPK